MRCPLHGPSGSLQDSSSLAPTVALDGLENIARRATVNGVTGVPLADRRAWIVAMETAGVPQAVLAVVRAPGTPNSVLQRATVLMDTYFPDFRDDDNH